ncbi:hypothetical protein T05_5855 [Trichinella murrelli]|uniref:Uncharacterized protein n=1 Tax=Trichinella murrelli TaxID=144512 RepID=A0A0V0UHK2_9BILA|nr:hypothetical protein T05_5855 [Trichinella murrelli]
MEFKIFYIMIALLSNTYGWDKSEKAAKKLESTLFRVVQYCSMAQCRSETVNRKQCYSNDGNYDPSSNCAAQEKEWKECVAFCYDEKLINLEEASTSPVDYKIDLLDLILKKFSSLAICDETQCRSEATKYKKCSAAYQFCSDVQRVIEDYEKCSHRWENRRPIFATPFQCQHNSTPKLLHTIISMDLVLYLCFESKLMFLLLLLLLIVSLNFGAFCEFQSIKNSVFRLCNSSQDNAFISCPSKYATEVLPQLRSLPWLNTFDLRAAKLDCSCQNMWLAFWEKILEPITPIESLSIEMDVLLWFLADVNRVCDLDCPKTVRDIYELPNQINLPKDAFNHCLTEGDPATESAIYENFKTRCGFGSLQLNVKQVIFGYNKTDDVVVCKATNSNLISGTSKECPTFKMTSFLEEPAKPDTFTWCMGDDTAVLSVNNVRPNSSGWIICFGNGYLPQAAAIPLLVITPPVYLRFEMDRVNQQELFIRFQLHSYPNVDLHLFIWENDLKNWRELSLTEEYTSTNGRRGALWFSRTLRSLASTTTEGEIQFTKMDTVCRTDLYNFTACNAVGCISKVFEIKPDENNVLCAANADSPTYQTPKSVKFNILRIHAVPTKHDDANYLNYADGQTDQLIQYSPMQIIIPFFILSAGLMLTVLCIIINRWRVLRQANSTLKKRQPIDGQENAPERTAVLSDAAENDIAL